MNKKETKKFIPYPTRPIRMSEKTWVELRSKKIKTGKNWDTFINDLIKDK